MFLLLLEKQFQLAVFLYFQDIAHPQEIVVSQEVDGGVKPGDFVVDCAGIVLSKLTQVRIS